MIKISIPLKRDGERKSAGEVVRMAVKELEEKCHDSKMGLRLKEFKKDQEKVALKYDILPELNKKKKNEEKNLTGQPEALRELE